MDITFSPTPFGTVHVTAVVPADEIRSARRKIAAQVGKRKLGKRLSTREHVFGSFATVGAIYRKS